MLSLGFSEKSLEVQRNVVIEEYKQSYLNQPYGDVWLLLRPLAYKKHPYQWATIGKDILHIANATLDDVKDFFFKYYAPNNAILVVAGDVDIDEINKLSKKWFAPIEKRDVPFRNLPEEPEQKDERKLSVKRDVPFDAIYKVYQMCSRIDKDFYATDLISDILSNSDSSRLYQSLIKDKKLFSDIDAYISGDIDKGLFVISGDLIKGVNMDVAEAAINEELTKIKTELISEYELNKVRNKIESTIIFSKISVLNKAMKLAYYELLGNAENINNETQEYLNVTTDKINKLANNIFKPTNSSTLYYNAEQNL
jgi:predicted Zn-dependent peptidase